MKLEDYSVETDKHCVLVIYNDNKKCAYMFDSEELAKDFYIWLSEEASDEVEHVYLTYGIYISATCD